MIAARLRRSPAPLLGLAAVATAAASWLPLLPVLPPLLTGDAFTGLAEPRLAGLFLRTLRLAGGAALLSLLLGLPLALLASRLAAPGRSLWRLLLPLPLLLPPLMIAQAWHGLTGMDGPLAALFALGVCAAPFPALLAARALERQAASSHEAALLAGGPRLALAEMLRTATPAALLGAAFAFVFAATDFAVPDYFASVGEKFSVYAAEVFNAWRRAGLDPADSASSYAEGMAVAAPLVALAGLVLLLALAAGDLTGGADRGSGRRPPLLPLGRAAAPAALLGLALTTLLVLLPLGRIAWETGRAGPLAGGSWSGRAGAAFDQALDLGREDLGRSLANAAWAGLGAMIVAPIWAHLLVRWRRRPRAVLLQTALALPLLAPAVGFGLGAIVVFNRDLFWNFYDGPGLPPLVLGGRYLPIAVFLLAERLSRVPREREEAAALAGASFAARLYRYRLGGAFGAWLLAGGLVAVFTVREVDLAILLPAANHTAAVRYFNALHFARDNFVAAFGLVIAAVLFLPVAAAAALRGLRGPEDR
ncbi:MAG: hypothetical protein D6702_08730 [Planctomycetota bacterium]|nr:MAG: hypothetical protein D6702_08730 [Planctomycetota bacterium]